MEKELSTKEPFNQSHTNSRMDLLSAANFLSQRKKTIKQIWEEKIRKEVLESEIMTSPVMVKYIDIFLNDLIKVLKHGEISPKSFAEEGVIKVHGGQRALFTDYFLPQLLKEFSVLREIINIQLYNRNLLSFEVRGIVDKVVDSAISLAANEFVEIQKSVS